MLNTAEITKLMNQSAQLAFQDYSQLVELNPDSLSVKSRQATLNIGTIGHVAHGKSTVVRSISGVNVR